MNDDFKNLEDELRALAPARPSKELEARLEKALGNRPPAKTANFRNHVHLLFWSAGFAAAAALTLLAYLLPNRSRPQPEPTPTLSPNEPSAQTIGPLYTEVESEHLLYDAREEGIYFLDDATPARKMRYQFIDSYTWQNAQDGSTISVEVPREEIILVRLDTI